MGGADLDPFLQQVVGVLPRVRRTAVAVRRVLSSPGAHAEH